MPTAKPQFFTTTFSSAVRRSSALLRRAAPERSPHVNASQTKETPTAKTQFFTSAFSSAVRRSSSIAAEGCARTKSARQRSSNKEDAHCKTAILYNDFRLGGKTLLRYRCGGLRPNEILTSTLPQTKKTPTDNQWASSLFGGGGKARTYDLHDVNVAL